MAKSKQVKDGPQSKAEDRQRQEEYWRQILDEQSKSGLTQREFCRRLSVPDHRFSWWKREIEIRDGKRPRPDKSKKRGRKPRSSIVPVKIAAPEPPSPQGGEESSFEIVLPLGRILRVPPRFEEKDLARLLQFLEERC